MDQRLVDHGRVYDELAVAVGLLLPLRSRRNRGASQNLTWNVTVS
jgi:hypothetical protein